MFLHFHPLSIEVVNISKFYFSHFHSRIKVPREIEKAPLTILCYPVGLTILDVDLHKDLLMSTPNRKQEKRTTLVCTIRLLHTNSSIIDSILNINYRSNKIQ